MAPDLPLVLAWKDLVLDPDLECNCILQTPF